MFGVNKKTAAFYENAAVFSEETMDHKLQIALSFFAYCKQQSASAICFYIYITTDAPVLSGKFLKFF